MKISCKEFELELKHPFSIAKFTRTSTPLLLLKVNYEGFTGFGEASMVPYMGESYVSAHAFLAKVDAADAQVKEALKGVQKGSKFMVFHPSWGYFAHQYGLEQVAIEVEGKEPKPKVLALILKEAREEKVKAIFTQPEFSDKSAKQIADELKIDVIKISPLASEWDANLITLAKAIAKQH